LQSFANFVFAQRKFAKTNPQATLVPAFNYSRSGLSRIFGKCTATSTKSIQPDPIDFKKNLPKLSIGE